MNTDLYLPASMCYCLQLENELFKRTSNCVCGNREMASRNTDYKLISHAKLIRDWSSRLRNSFVVKTDKTHFTSFRWNWNPNLSVMHRGNKMLSSIPITIQECCFMKANTQFFLCLLCFFFFYNSPLRYLTLIKFLESFIMFNGNLFEFSLWFLPRGFLLSQNA